MKKTNKFILSLSILMIALLVYAFIIEPKYSIESKPTIKKSTSYDKDEFKTGDELVRQLQEKHGDLLYDTFSDAEYEEEELDKSEYFSDSKDFTIIDTLNSSEQSFENNSSLKEYSVVSFRVHNDQLKKIKTSHKAEFSSVVNDVQLQKELWHRFTQLIPSENRTMIKRFKIMTDGTDNTLGYVQQMYEEDYWELALDYKDAENSKDLYETLIHEYGHLFSLNSFEYTKERSCQLDELLDVCYKADSYLYTFYSNFWQGELAKTWPGESASEDEVIDFYDLHSEKFVSDYAATDVTEDFAESWMFFILTEKPKSNQISDDKILFFYQYPELVQLRNTLLENLNEQYK